jgi:quercetin dioxygenase-like cupin family protein
MSMPVSHWAALAFSLAVVPVSAAADPQPLFDNPEVVVLDLHLAKGEATPRSSAAYDTVILYASAGHIRTEAAEGRGTARHYRFGDAVFIPKGAGVREVATGKEPVHLVVVTLKAAPKRIANPTGLPPAFPRPGVVKRLDNDKVVVWNYAWRENAPTPMHFHDKDVVLAYRYDGTLRSTTPDGKSVDNSFKAGEVRFNKGDRVHSELLLTKHESAVMMELKPQG